MTEGMQDNSLLPQITRSDAWWTRAQGLIPAGTQTLAKGPSQHSLGIAPKYARRGKGGRLWDVDGNDYLDLEMAIGPLILGYCHPVVDAAIQAQLADGITFSLMHPLEVELAELLRECVPNAESVRFSKTGADVTSAAVRVARAHTRRERVICCGYHGWHDWYIAVTDRSSGVPLSTQALTSTFNYGDIESLLAVIDDGTACVIMEPLVFQSVEPGFFRTLRALCDKHGVVLIFDEMWTGFRAALGGAQEFLGVRADLALFSKAMANGMPISAVVGRQDIMAHFERDVFFFTTFGGEALSLAAALACIGYIQKNPVIEYIAHLGALLRSGLQRAIDAAGLNDCLTVAGHDFRTALVSTLPGQKALVIKTFVQQELLRRRILWNGVHNFCYSHTEEDVDYLEGAYLEVTAALGAGLQSGRLESLLEGECLQPVFRKPEGVNARPRTIGAQG